MAVSIQQQLGVTEGVTDSRITPIIAPSPSSLPSSVAFQGDKFSDGIYRPHRKFLSVVSKYAASIPLKNFFITAFDIPALIVENNLRNLSENFGNNDIAKLILTQESNISPEMVGCVFCRSLDFVGEKLESDILQVQTRGFRSSPIAGHRSSNFLNNLTLNFYESSVSFIDHIIRPWTVLMSYYSTITRNPNDQGAQLISNLRQDIYCYVFSRGGSAKDDAEREKIKKTEAGMTTYNFPSKVRKTLVFKNCFPTNFSNLDYNHNDITGGMETVNTTFSYSNYEVYLGSTAFDDRAETIAPTVRTKTPVPSNTSRPQVQIGGQGGPTPTERVDRLQQKFVSGLEIG